MKVEKKQLHDPLTLWCGIVWEGKTFRRYHPKCLFLKFVVMNGNPLRKRETLKCLNSFSFFAKVHAYIFLYVYMFICFLFDSRLGIPSIVLEKGVGMESFKKKIFTSKKINADNIFFHINIHW